MIFLIYVSTKFVVMVVYAATNQEWYLIVCKNRSKTLHNIIYPHEEK